MLEHAVLLYVFYDLLDLMCSLGGLQIHLRVLQPMNLLLNLPGCAEDRFTRLFLF